MMTEPRKPRASEPTVPSAPLTDGLAASSESSWLAGSTDPIAAAGHNAAPAWDSWSAWLSLWLYAFFVYTGLVVLAVTSSALNSLQAGVPVHLANLIGHRAIEEYTCAIFVPLFFWLVHRFPIDRRNWQRSVPVLFTVSVICVAVKCVFIYLPLIHIVFPQDNKTLAATLALTADVLSDFWGVIGVAHAIEFYRRAQGRERLAVELRAQLSQAQLEMIRSQLHPHFLFNALNGVAALMHRDVHAADRMVTDLAGLLRATLQHSNTPEIPLSEELTLLERYLGIAALRFPDRLKISYDIAPDVQDALVPQFLLQPLAENAVEHGIARSIAPGTLVISASRSDDRVFISVCDDGPGLRGGKSGKSVGMGIGLTNTRARLQAMYGTAQELHVESALPDRGVRVRIVLPYRRRPTAVPRATDLLTAPVLATV